MTCGWSKRQFQKWYGCGPSFIFGFYRIHVKSRVRLISVLPLSLCLSLSRLLPVFIMFLISVLCSSTSIYAHIQCFYTMNGYTQFQTVHPPPEEGGVVELLPAGHYRACRDRPRPKRTSLLNIYTSMCTSGLPLCSFIRRGCYAACVDVRDVTLSRRRSL